ncbi:family 20 glycosylhydrolase [Paenibacillus sp. CC-CFT747]|nr:family 20 glycosylhydrolase [Paenibacillus sp. CC-CFT747]
MKKELINLVPNPKSLEPLPSVLRLTSGYRISLPEEDKQAIFPIAQRLQESIHRVTGILPAIAVRTLPMGLNLLRFDRMAGRITHEEAYLLRIASDGILIRYASPAGAFHAVSTLKQLVMQYGKQLPCMNVEDEPDFQARGIMLDISRSKIPRLETLFRLVDLMADLKMNQLQLYVEGFSFAYESFPEVWKSGTPVTGEEILLLDQYCRERFIQLVPNQNSFGHMTPWLERKEFNDLADCPTGCEAPWGRYDKPMTLNPLDKRSLELIERTYGDFLPYFTSGLFNVGCDETFDLGQGRSKAACEERGKGRVYLEFLLQVHKLVSRYGKKMMFWGDIIKQHPDLISELPKDVIVLEWGYHASRPSAEDCTAFQAAGIPYYVCPGTSSWNSITGLTDNMNSNLLTAAVNGKQYGAAGYLITDWGDCGHWQPLPVSYAGFVYGAALSWNVERNRHLDVPAYLDRYVFKDSSCRLGQFAVDLGNYYLLEKQTAYNGSGVFRTLYYHQLNDTNTDLDFLQLPDPGREDFSRVKEQVAALAEELEEAMPQCSDAPLVKREYALAIKLVLHGAELGLFKTDPSSDLSGRERRLELLLEDLDGILLEYKEVWLMRNRRGASTAASPSWLRFGSSTAKL